MIQKHNLPKIGPLPLYQNLVVMKVHSSEHQHSFVLFFNYTVLLLTAWCHWFCCFCINKT